MRIKSLQINKGYLLNDDADHRHQPLLVQSKDIHKYNRDDYHKSYSITYEEVDQIHLVNPCSGELIPFFMLVPCNHCNLCFQRKQSTLSMRAKLESTLHTHNPFFFDLTFSNEHYPADIS